jgi:hypothetical protein
MRETVQLIFGKNRSVLVKPGNNSIMAGKKQIVVRWAIYGCLQAVMLGLFVL